MRSLLQSTALGRRHQVAIVAQGAGKGTSRILHPWLAGGGDEEHRKGGGDRAVKGMKNTRCAMNAATSSRARLMADWKTFLQQSASTWGEYTAMLKTQERALQDNLNTAVKNLAAAYCCQEGIAGTFGVYEGIGGTDHL